MKHILVPFDSFKVSLKALEYAAMLSSDPDTQVTALHLVDSQYYKSKSDFEFDIKKITELEIRPRFIEAAKINPNLKKIKLQVLGKKLDVADHILNFASDNQVDFIVMGRHGLSTGDKEEGQLEDTVSYKVVLGARCPVFIFTQMPSKSEIKTIVLPLDLSDGSRVKVPLAIKLAIQFGASVYLFSVTEDLDSNETVKLKKLQKDVFDEIDRHKIIVKKIIVESDELPKALLEYSESISANLIIIMNRPRSLWNDLFIAPSANRIISFSKTPVLSMRGRDRNTQA